MAKILEAIRALLAKIFGGKNETQRRLAALEKMEAGFTASRRDNVDRLDELKSEIRTLESRAINKKKEMEQSHGDSKRIVVGEIERIFRELDRLRGRENIIAANLDRIDVALSKIREAKAALSAGVTEEQLDNIALEIQDLFETLKTLDRTSADLEREKYEAPKVAHVDVETRIAETEGAEKAPVALSPETEKRLKQLETEEA